MHFLRIIENDRIFDAIMEVGLQFTTLRLVGLGHYIFDVRTWVQIP